MMAFVGCGDGKGHDDADTRGASATGNASAYPGQVDGSGGTSTTADATDGGTDAGSSGETGDPTVEPSACLSPEDADPAGTDRITDVIGEATVEVHDRQACHRSYTLSTTQPLRDGLPNNPRTVTEVPGASTLRTGNDMLDALYALTLEEVRECSVDAISDWSFNGGNPVGCGDGGCFETGRLWNYVWTRDTAYAVDLGLAAVDPVRARNSLQFKLSERRSGGDLQIVQDTGTGGSYPVSSDRVAWALGAWQLYLHLDGAEREAFAQIALEALSNTLEHDRAVVYDPADGLYFGEQSFLDWRQQSYPSWTADDVVHIGMSKTLSTNLLHARAMQVAATLAEAAGDTAVAERYSGWSQALRGAIRERFWLPDEGLYSTFVTTYLDPSPARQYDLLGSALAVLLGVADEEQAASILSRYPHYGPGAPVLWPQQQQTPIYHNRGEWPFVTAYWLRAAQAADNDAVADRMVHALIRGAALNLSNMENFEAASGAPWFEDGAFSGPVVNSQRQLWSVAGFASMVHHTLFGLRATPDGLLIAPYVTRGLRNGMFAGSDTLVLNDYRYRGHSLSVVLHLPPRGGLGGSYEVAETRLDGEPVPGNAIAVEDLAQENRIDVYLSDAGDRPPAAITLRTTTDWRDIFAPRSPRITALGRGDGHLRLSLSTSGEEASDVRFAVYRDGQRIAEDLPGSTTSWDDPDSNPDAPASPCYAVETCFSSSGNCSQHSPPVCWFGEDSAAISEFAAQDLTITGGTPSNSHGMFHHDDWGADGHAIELPTFTAQRSGTHLVQVLYGNGAGPIDTGITCAVKRVTVTDLEQDTVVGEGMLVMPHLGTWDRWANSSFVPAQLEAGRSYRVVIEGDPRAVNMSSFAHFSSYTGGQGGSAGAFNLVNIAAVKLLPR